MHDEVTRLKPKHETVAGEDCFHRKLRELEFLLESQSDEDPGDGPGLKATLFFVCDDDATYAELEHLTSGLRSTVAVVVHRRKDRLGSSKSANVKEGFQLACRAGHDLIGYTDADVSSHLGQIGFLIRSSTMAWLERSVRVGFPHRGFSVVSVCGNSSPGSITSSSGSWSISLFGILSSASRCSRGALPSTFSRTHSPISPWHSIRSF
jgi:hypothetical protein